MWVGAVDFRCGSSEVDVDTHARAPALTGAAAESGTAQGGRALEAQDRPNLGIPGRAAPCVRDAKAAKPSAAFNKCPAKGLRGQRPANLSSCVRGM